ncbi:MAG: hypothetical protein H3C31_07130 [Brumimicrobium sp.]|nr:hypothetical protein [Brumimicrobium sp.]
MKKVLKILAIIIFIGSIVYLLIAANKEVENQIMNKPVIHLKLQDEIPLITESEILGELYKYNLFTDETKKSDLKIKEIEKYLKHSNEVLTTQVYTGLTKDWYIDVKTKRPIARILSNKISDFYIDNDFTFMRLSPYIKPRILVFSGLDQLITNDLSYSKIINNDSLKTKLMLDQIYRISKYVCNDTFYNAQIVQVHYSQEDGFLLVPRVGLQKIIFGFAESEEIVEEKFKKLTTFYEKVIPYEGWGKYETINLKFKNQIVAKKKQ